MTQHLYKAVWHLDGERVMQDVTGPEAMTLPRIRAWLRENGREADFVNYYFNDSAISFDVDLVVVLSNRNTALMLKLAVA